LPVAPAGTVLRRQPGRFLLLLCDAVLKSRRTSRLFLISRIYARTAPFAQIAHKEHTNMNPKNTICLWFDKDAHAAARFYAATFPDSK